MKYNFVVFLDKNDVPDPNGGMIKPTCMLYHKNSGQPWDPDGEENPTHFTIKKSSDHLFITVFDKDMDLVDISKGQGGVIGIFTPLPWAPGHTPAFQPREALTVPGVNNKHGKPLQRDGWQMNIPGSLLVAGTNQHPKACEFSLIVAGIQEENTEATVYKYIVDPQMDIKP